MSVKVQAYEKAEFLKKASALINKAKINEKAGAEFIRQCESDEITSIDALKTQLAMYKFESILSEEEHFEAKVEVKEEQKEEKDSVAESFSAPIATPDVNAAFAEKKAEKVKNDHWSALRDYVGK